MESSFDGSYCARNFRGNVWNPRSMGPIVPEILEGMYGIVVRRVLLRQKF